MPRIGMGIWLNRHGIIDIPPFFSDLVQWACGDAETEEGVSYIRDKKGDWDSSARVGGVYLASGTIDTGLVSTALTYIDATTGLEVNDTTDVSGLFVVPANGMKYLTIDSHFFPCEESAGLYIGATDAEYYSVALATWDISDSLPSYADENGYTPSDNSTMYWDVDTTIIIASGVNITSGAGYVGVPLAFAFVGNDFAYVSLDGTVNLGTTHDIEFETILVNGNSAILGLVSDPDSWVQMQSGSILSYRADFATIEFNVSDLIDGQYHIYRLSRAGTTTVKLYVDNSDNPFDTQVLPSNANFSYNALFIRNGSLETITSTKRISEGLNTYTFTPPSTVNNTGAAVGTITNDDGNRIQTV